jgi:hypothetical protein
MTVVQRLQLLPAPGATSGATAVAVAGQDDPRVKAVVPVARNQRGRQQLPQEAQPAKARQDRIDQGGRQHSGGAPTRAKASLAADPASGRLINFSRLSSLPFMVQVLGQQPQAGRPQVEIAQNSLSGHRDAALLGSDVYRRAGGEPEILPDSATFIRLAV